MSLKKYAVAIVGITGAVGQIMLKLLAERNFPIKTLLPLASYRSAGKTIQFKDQLLTIKEARPESFTGVDLAFFSAGTSVSRQLAPEAARRGALVIDNSNAFRMDTNVPLIVPEVNPECIRDHQGVIANPNCSTIQLLVALKPLHDYAKIKRIVVSTYQAVSGTGVAAIEELKEQSRQLLDNKKAQPSVYPHQIAFNVLPHIDVFDDTGSSLEELKMVRETKKVLDDQINVTATCVRVPVVYGHSEAVNVETERELAPENARTILASAPGIAVIDEPVKLGYPLPILAAGRDEVFVGRIRKDSSVLHGINLWIVADNLRKGAALNAVQIAELAKQDGLV
ncbi:MAG TPA: aspartate-semialdehyde dehydrogenase [bacterium]|nr:aspartate-semialdehyde dehydrogenase [bacterium]